MIEVRLFTFLDGFDRTLEHFHIERETDRLNLPALAIAEQLACALEPARAIAGVRDVRVMGAIGVIELERMGDLNAIKQRFIEEGVFIRPFGNIVYITPPLIIGSEDLARLTGAMLKITAEIAAS